MEYNCIQQSLLINIFIEEIKIVEMRGYFCIILQEGRALT